MSDLFRIVLTYFPLIAVVFTLISGAIAYYRTPKTPILKYYQAFASTFLVMGLLQLAGGYMTFFYIFLPPSESVLVVMYWAYYFAFLVITAWWILFADGAEMMAQSTFGSNNATLTKISHVVSVVVLPIIYIAGHQFGFFAQMVEGIVVMFGAV